MWRRRCSACSKSSAEVGAAGAVRTGASVRTRSDSIRRSQRAREVLHNVRMARCSVTARLRSAGASSRHGGKSAGARAWQRGGLRDQSAAALAQHAERLFMRQLSLCGAAQRGGVAASAPVAYAAGLSAPQPLGARGRASRKVHGADVFQVPACAKASSLELLRKGAAKARNA